MIDIVSFFRMEKLQLISVCTIQTVHVQGQYGPFEPMEQTTVPLWLAVILKKNNKCRIVVPKWLSVGNSTVCVLNT